MPCSPISTQSKKISIGDKILNNERVCHGSVSYSVPHSEVPYTSEKTGGGDTSDGTYDRISAAAVAELLSLTDGH